MLKQMFARVGDKIEVGDKIGIEKRTVEAGRKAVLDTICAVIDGTTFKLASPMSKEPRSRSTLMVSSVAKRSST